MDDAREIRECVERAIDESGPGAIDSLSARLCRAGADWAYYPSIRSRAESIMRWRHECCSLSPL